MTINEHNYNLSNRTAWELDIRTKEMEASQLR